MNTDAESSLTQILQSVISEIDKLLLLLKTTMKSDSKRESKLDAQRDLNWLTVAYDNVKNYRDSLIQAAREENSSKVAWIALNLTTMQKYFADDLPESDNSIEIKATVKEIKVLCAKPAFHIDNFGSNALAGFDL